MNSDYTYPGTNILINVPGIKDQDTLDRFERGRTALRLAELKVKPIKGGFDMEHLQKIHQYIFQDVYPFAGQIWTTNIGKNGFWFADFKSIDWVTGNVFMSLKDDKHLKGLSAVAFSRKAAQYYSDINYIHPFREGNGRAIREFFRQLALESGYDLRWSQVSKEEYISPVLKTNEPSAIKELSNVLYKCIVGSSGLQDKGGIYPKTETELKDILKKAKGLAPGIQDGEVIDLGYAESAGALNLNKMNNLARIESFVVGDWVAVKHDMPGNPYDGSAGRLISVQDRHAEVLLILDPSGFLESPFSRWIPLSDLRLVTSEEYFAWWRRL